MMNILNRIYERQEGLCQMFQSLERRMAILDGICDRQEAMCQVVTRLEERVAVLERKVKEGGEEDSAMCQLVERLRERMADLEDGSRWERRWPPGDGRCAGQQQPESWQ